MFYIKEVLKFLNRNLYLIITGAIIFTLLYMFISTSFFGIGNLKNNLEQENNGSEQLSVEDSSREDPLTEAMPVSFYFYVEHKEGGNFSNNLLIEQYLLAPSMLIQASLETDTQLRSLIEDTGNLINVNYNESGESKIVGVRRNDTSNLIEVYVNIGNERENLRISRYYFDLIGNKEVPFLSDKNIHIFQRPQLKKLDEKYDAITEEELVQPTTNYLEYIKDTIIGFIIGIILSVFLLLLRTFTSKKLTYTFSYRVRETDNFMLITNYLSQEDELLFLLQYPASDTKVVVIEDISNAKMIHTNKFTEVFGLKQNTIAVGSVDKILELDSSNHIIYIIEEGKTTRTWYEKQRKMDKFYNLPVSVVQINNSLNN